MPQTCPGSAISPGRVRSQRGLIALLVGLALGVGGIIGAPAATTWTVCAGGCDHTSIKAAIAAPTTLDGDTLALAAGTYTEAGIVVNKSLTLQGAGATGTIVQAASSKGTASNAVFFIPSGVTVTLQDLTVRYGRTPGLGGGLSNAGTLTLTRCTIRDNSAEFPGGGLYNTGALTLTHSTVSGNRSTYPGGGLYNGGILSLTHSTISRNTAAREGGGLSNDATLTLTSSIVANNPEGGIV